MFNNKGFTLIELLVVIAIIGVLVSVSTPIVTGYINRAKATEAYAALGTLRTAERIYRAEHGVYTDSWAELSDYIEQNDLAGTFFSPNCYSIPNADTTTFTAQCLPNASTATRGNEVSNLGTITLDEEGVLSGP